MVFNRSAKKFAGLAVLTAITISVAACGAPTTTTTTDASPAAGGEATGASPAASNLSGNILADGSSTVFPITEAMAEEFMKVNPGVRVTVGTSGTGGGFQKFCGKEVAISNASRPIKQEEIDKCAANGVEYVEVPVAFDALTVVVNPQNDWATCLTTEELKRIWEPGAQGTISNWNQVRDGFPDAPLVLYGPGTDSGTFDYFTDVINGEEGASRGDFTASEDDNVLVQGVEGDKNALGYFGFAYYAEQGDRLKAVQVDSGDGNCVAPSPETVIDGTYKPLSRPLFVYVRKDALQEPQVKAFMQFVTDPANKGFVEETGYVPLNDETSAQAQQLVQ